MLMTDNFNKRKIYALGETVLDLVSEGGYSLQATPGGSVLNASVSLGRMGADINLISEYGNDKAGDLIENFLQENSVNTQYCIRHQDYKTSLALAFLDNAKKATYTFYLDSPESLPDVLIPEIRTEDVLLYGSFYSVKPDRQTFVKSVLQKAIRAKAVIYYDLNIRKAHVGSLEELMPFYLNNIAAATIVKGSDEDFQIHLATHDPDTVYSKINMYCKVLILTNGSRPLHIFTPDFHKTYKIPAIVPVSTIGAGDNFNAGFIYGLVNSGCSSRQMALISELEADKMVACGIAFSTETCLSRLNYIHGNFGPDFWKNYI